MMIDYNARYTLRAFRCNDLVGVGTKYSSISFFHTIINRGSSSTFLFCTNMITWPTISLVLCTNHNSSNSAFDENDIITFSATMYFLNIMKFARLDCLKFGNVCKKVNQYTQNMITYHATTNNYTEFILE